jgi:AbrB family looped-hinge helix DNA binding protein
MVSATLTSKGQITIPKSVRDALALEPGDRLELRVRDDGIIEVRVQDIDLLSLVGVVKPGKRGVSVEQMNRDIAASAAEGSTAVAKRRKK